MNLIFLHTADWQLGKPFAPVGNDPKGFQLQEQRLQIIRGLSNRIVDSKAAFVLVAGDLVDSSHVSYDHSINYALAKGDFDRQGVAFQEQRHLAQVSRWQEPAFAALAGRISYPKK